VCVWNVCVSVCLCESVWCVECVCLCGVCVRVCLWNVCVCVGESVVCVCV